MSSNVGAIPQIGAKPKRRRERRRLNAPRIVGLTYLGLLLAAPVGMIMYRTFENGITR